MSDERDLPCYERGPYLEDIQFERNPRLWQVIEEGRQIEEEMHQLRKAEDPILFCVKSVERAKLAKVLEVPDGEARKELGSERG